MIAAIGVWVKNLIFLMLFAAFIELLLPFGNMKKFLRMVIGLFLLLAVLKPVTVVVAGDFSWADIPVLSAERKGVEMNFANDKIKRDRLTYSVYERELSLQMKKVLETMPEISEVRVKVEVDTDKNIDDGNLVKSVVIKAKEVKAGNKIRVDLGDNTEEESLTETVKEKIRQRIHALYQIPLPKISFG